MNNTFLVITSIADDSHPILQQYGEESDRHGVQFILVGDVKSPKNFTIDHCDYYSVERQNSLNFKLVDKLPFKHYARKNIGYLAALLQGAEVIIETDDDNIPKSAFWNKRSEETDAHMITDKGWINIYKYFSDKNIWPRGFDLTAIKDTFPALGNTVSLKSYIQQGLADDNPDVDAIYRLIFPLPLHFRRRANIALGHNSICPFNSQNTTWFKEAFPLMYLPSYCSFRMTDIWRSFVAQRVAWSCDWYILFHNSTVKQERNHHNLMNDFIDEVPGYMHNKLIMDNLISLDLKRGPEYISENMIACYQKLIELKLVDSKEIELLTLWLEDVSSLTDAS